MLGIGLEGYFILRFAKGILDELEICAIALADGERKVVLISTDQCMLKADVIEAFKESITEATGIPNATRYSMWRLPLAMWP